MHRVEVNGVCKRMWSSCEACPQWWVPGRAAADAWALQRELSVLYARFYGALVGGLLLIYHGQRQAARPSAVTTPCACLVISCSEAHGASWRPAFTEPPIAAGQRMKPGALPLEGSL